MHEIRLTYEADLPARSGLGTSSSFAVGMLNAFYALKGKYADKKKLADEAIYLERNLCQEAGGWQDQIAASFGGFNRINFNADAEYSFRTEKGLSMKYTVKGGEIFFNRKEKSVTRSSVMRAFHRARQLQHEKGFVSGPKELGTFGASYLYPVFLRLGVCSNMASSEDLD